MSNRTPALTTPVPDDPDDPADDLDESPAPLPVLSLHDLVAAATRQPEDAPRLTPIEVPEWGCTLMARPLTRSERIWLEERCVDPRTGKKDLKKADTETFCRMVVQPSFRGRTAEYQALLESEPAARVLDRIHIKLAEINDGLKRDAQGRPLDGDAAEPVAAAERRFRR